MTGEGAPQAELMFVGEGPGYQEDRQGRPFVGPAGQFLNELLSSVGLRREDVFITNMVKCRPPSNRDPFPSELEACAPYLDEQLRLVNPKVIVPLGRHALAKWLPRESIGKVRARPRSVHGHVLYPLYHPAAALHNASLRDTIERDFQGVRGLIGKATVPPTSAPDGKQLGLLRVAPPADHSQPSAPSQVDLEGDRQLRLL